ncbi:MAG TPA: DUF2510 domain-containing protein [Ilumatobacteraceae bacterium]|nr:DUF2510 domain-containing protein [Ilumatobacteraceae bacterium]
MSGTQGGWHPDPYGRHQLRWWDGQQWTSQVSDQGVVRDENAPAQPAPPPMPPQQPVYQAPPQQPQYQQPQYQQAPPQYQQPQYQQPVQQVAVQPNPSSGSNKRTIIAVAAVVVLVAIGAIVYVTSQSKDEGQQVGPGGSAATTLPNLSEDGQAYVDAMVEGSAALGNLPFTSDEVRCMATAVVDDVGVEALQAAGITPDDVRAAGDITVAGLVDQAGAEALATDVAGCIDWHAMVDSELAGQNDLGLTTDQMHCIGDRVGESQLIRDLFVQSFMGTSEPVSPDAAATLSDGVVGCIDFGQMVTDALSAAGVQITPDQASCIGSGMNSSALLRAMFAQQFATMSGGSDTPTETTAGSATTEVLSTIVQDMFGTTDAATTDELTKEMAAIFNGCGVPIG